VSFYSLSDKDVLSIGYLGYGAMVAVVSLRKDLWGLS